MRRLSLAVLTAFFVGSCTSSPTKPTETPTQAARPATSEDGTVSTTAVTTERLRLRLANGPDIMTTLVTGQVIEVPVNVKLDIWAEIRRLETDRARVIVDWGNGFRDFDGCGSCRVENTYAQLGRYQVSAQVIDLTAPSGTAPILSVTVTLTVIPPPVTAAPTPCTTATTFVGNLNGTSTASAFETSTTTFLPSLGWTNVTGAAWIWDGASNGALLGTTQYGNYEVQHDTGVVVLPSTTYTLDLIMGYMAGLTGGASGYSFQLGTVTGGIFIGLTAPMTGVAPYAGSLNGSVASATGHLVLVTGSSVSGGTMAVRWAQTSSLAGGTSDYFGIDNVTLSATRCVP